MSKYSAAKRTKLIAPKYALREKARRVTPARLAFVSSRKLPLRFPCLFGLFKQRMDLPAHNAGKKLQSVPFYLDAWMRSKRKIPQFHQISASEISSCRLILSDVPVVPTQVVMAYARMLHFTIHQKTLAPGDIHYQAEALQRSSMPASPGSRSWMDYELVHDQEEMILQCIRDGNLEYKQLLDKLNYSVLDLPLSENSLRSESNKLASGAVLYRRAAIEGGLSPKAAMDLETKYLFQADKLTTVTELRKLNLQMLDDFVRHVHEARAGEKYSRHIHECCEYIAAHLTDDLSVQKIAKEIGYAEYYLTRKFQKETGVRLTEYIKDARLEYAKVCLLSTQLSVEEISDLLQFNSRNYFTKTFRKKTGKTPTEFRTQRP